jgi:hypothetical protein
MEIPDIHSATKSYEAWVRRHIDVRRADLDLKHEVMRESPFVFLRGTFYRWLQRWPKNCEPLVDAPSVLAVGDLHIENFGTWRDAEGRLIWGVNDVDEACRLPYTHDLVRLATSALLAIEVEHFTISPGSACEAILAAYTASLEAEGEPVVLAERRRWLRHIALNQLRDPTVFWEKLTALPNASGSLPKATLRQVLPERGLPFRVVRRIAGVGSLRTPALRRGGRWRGGLIARRGTVVGAAAGAVPARAARPHRGTPGRPLPRRSRTRSVLLRATSLDRPAPRTRLPRHRSRDDARRSRRIETAARDGMGNNEPAPRQRTRSDPARSQTAS